MERKELMKLIHIAASRARLCPDCGKVLFLKECRDCGVSTIPLSEERYRRILESFGASSCRFLPDPDLEKVYRFFLRAGFVPREDPAKGHAAARRRTIAITVKEAKALFGEKLWEQRLMGFVRKAIGKPTLWECDDKELRKALGWLRRYRKYLEKREEERKG